MVNITRRALLAGAAGALLLAACGGGGPRLDDRVLQLSITYTVDGPASAELTGSRGAATAGADVECRLTTDGEPLVGEATANQFGAFTMPLDHTRFPPRIPNAEEFKTFNEIIECRPDGGQWVSPLRPPLVRVG